MDEEAMDEIGDLCARALDSAADPSALAPVPCAVESLCERFPLYLDLD